MISNQATTIVVGLGEIKVTQDPSAVLTYLSLGPCIGVCAYDPVAKLAGMAHIVLPSSDHKNGRNGPKFADVGVPQLLEELKKQGAAPYRLVVKIAGGAQISKAQGLGDVFQIGERNTEAVKSALAGLGNSIKAAAIGGHHGRTMRFYLDSGKTMVTTAGQEINEL